ncbi:restriction endonuclease subunit S [Vibrio sp. S11_S32]|uniref:restriction endonuclease subunit S n=1 Tax=Vibrio sp. S11_S32 TaxID=2720225 RepID=UPI00168010CB|nr:restriction endonuclease subunit S [Vibrio sp. S11_S32]MBD1576901.1 restriction endonuclease subunit S [Vibrio sp. S11_S32]
MIGLSFIEKLLDGASVSHLPLEKIAKIKHGKDWKKLASGDIPVYGSGGIMGYVDTYSYDKPTVLIPRKGTITNLFYVDSAFWNVDTIYYTEIDGTKILPKYLYYVIKTIDLMSLDTGSGRPSLTQAILNKLLIPIPCPDNPEKSLAIQAEIVRILDAFTAMTAELTAELSMRKKQYNYYRDKLLSFEEGDVEWKTLGWIGEVRMCKRIMKNETSDIGDIPFFKIGTFGKEPNAYISRDTFEEYKSKYNYPRVGEILISASGTIGRAVIFNGEDAYFQDSNIVWLENDESKVLNKYLFYFYQIANWNVSDGGVIKRLYNDNIKKTLIPVPYPDDPERSLAKQARIVAILDKFDTLTNSISEGLPREIELRQKQYEYYRDMLLSFPKPMEETA